MAKTFMYPVLTVEGSVMLATVLALLTGIVVVNRYVFISELPPLVVSW
jgi:hypothetical protein